jgi:hypothetical protein
MRILNNKKGATLVVVLILAAVALVISAGLLYMVIEGTKVSGGAKKYATACEAAIGGAGPVYELINNRADPGLPLPGWTVNGGLGAGSRLFDSATGKLYVPPTLWLATSDSSITIDGANPATFDVSFRLGAYAVYAKISSTVQGNSGEGAGVGPWHSGGSINSRLGGGGGGSSNIVVQSFPYLYSIEILSQNAANPVERCKLSILYQF